MGDVTAVALRDGNLMPQLGFGTWQIPADDCPRLVGEALRVGYRAIDTAQGFGNEEGIGRAIRESGIARGEIFVTSKLRNGAHRRELALRAFDETMNRLGLEQIDLFLINWPLPAEDRYVEAWTALVELQQQGHIRSIGVSNFERPHIERIIAETGVAPAVNQIELHPLYQQRDVRGFHQRRSIRIASWSPLGPGTANSAWWWTHGRKSPGNMLADPVIAAIARDHGRSPAQIIVRWHLQEGLILNVKSTRTDHIAENFSVLGFELSAEDMYRIEALDRPDDGKIGAQPAEWNEVY